MARRMEALKVVAWRMGTVGRGTLRMGTVRVMAWRMGVVGSGQWGVGEGDGGGGEGGGGKRGGGEGDVEDRCHRHRRHPGSWWRTKTKPHKEKPHHWDGELTRDKGGEITQQGRRDSCGDEGGCRARSD
ncbi:protein argonaute 18-like [Telopea speciosissima]|uniref:protein argonaute 18-like n=1 Tax=Telopea speciosissima TaxID=54955 RepID=UPI001CC62821|nr:protein argonaute 18-like [Telopea speciosissima]